MLDLHGVQRPALRLDCLPIGGQQSVTGILRQSRDGDRDEALLGQVRREMAGNIQRGVLTGHGAVRRHSGRLQEVLPRGKGLHLCHYGLAHKQRGKIAACDGKGILGLLIQAVVWHLLTGI